MLSPVPKISAADAAYGPTVQPTARAQPSEAASRQTATVHGDGDGVNLPTKAVIAALAGEFQLTRGTAVLAETLGRLMNLPRHDGEAIETYVTRLTEALRALPASQRLALEQQVGKAMQGLSLAMLAEILKQPTGPEAARLALLIELSRYKGTDLAAKAAVSSYQQNNNSANPLQNPLRPPMQQNASPPNGPAGQSVTGQSAAGAMPAQLAKAAARLLPLLTSPMALGGAAVKTSVAALTARAELFSPPANKTSSTPAIREPEARSETAPRPLPPQNGTVTEKTAPDIHPTNQPRAENGETRAAAQHRASMKAEQQEARSTSSQASAPGSGGIEDMKTLLLAAVEGRFSGKPNAATALAPQPAAPPLPQGQEAAAEKPAAMPAAAIHPAVNDAETQALRPEAQSLPRMPLDQDARMAMLEQSASQSMIAAAFAKEGIPLPLVAYPPAEDEHESQSPPRGGGPFSEDEGEAEADSGAENPDGQDDREERIAANDESGTPGIMPAAASDDSAENYYLRMSGMP